MREGHDGTGAARFAGWVIAPQAIVLGLVVSVAAMLGFGFSLAALLVGALLLSAGCAALIWRTLLRWREPPGFLLGAFSGLLAGAVAAGLSFGAAAADKHIGPRFGGSLLDALAGPVIAGGVRTGFDAHATGTAVDVLTMPHRGLVGFAGGMIAMMVVAAVTLGLIALPILSGLMGGIATAWRMRRQHKRSRLRFEHEPS